MDPDQSPYRVLLLLLVVICLGAVTLSRAQTPPLAESAPAPAVEAADQAEAPLALATEEETDEEAPPAMERGEIVVPIGDGALIAILFILLGFSCFFSGSETALFSLSKYELSGMERKPNPSKTERSIITLMRDGKSTLTTILIGNMMVNVAASLVVGTLVYRHFGQYPLLSFISGTLVATLALLILGEIFPKSLAIEYADTLAHFVARPLLGFRRAFIPLRAIFETITDAIFSLLRLPSESEDEAVGEQEIKGLVTMGHIEGIIQEDQREMIEGVFEFNDETVNKIMTPRVALDAFPIDTPREEFIDGIVKSPHSRVLVYRDNIDRIVGVLHVKEVLLYPERDLRQLMRKPLFVPEKKRLSSLLNDFRKEKQHLAVVVDEYGGTAGCVTLNDLLEEIFGDLVEIGEAEEFTITTVGEDRYEVDGLHRIGDLNDDLDLNLPEDIGTTVSGLISNVLGDFPNPRTELKVGNVTFVVQKMTARRVSKALVIVDRSEETHDEEEREGDRAESRA